MCFKKHGATLRARGDGACHFNSTSTIKSNTAEGEEDIERDDIGNSSGNSDFAEHRPHQFSSPHQESGPSAQQIGSAALQIPHLQPQVRYYITLHHCSQTRHALQRRASLKGKLMYGYKKATCCKSSLHADEPICGACEITHGGQMRRQSGLRPGRD